MPEAQVIGIEGDPDVELRSRCEHGLGHRLSEPEVQQRLDHELAIIADLGFAGYFLTVAEVVRLIKTMGVRVAARGSAVSSLVVHALGISPIDPMSYGSFSSASSLDGAPHFLTSTSMWNLPAGMRFTVPYWSVSAPTGWC